MSLDFHSRCFNLKVWTQIISVVEPDGSIREVDYTADSKNGFNAVVKTVSKKDCFYCHF